MGRRPLPKRGQIKSRIAANAINSPCFLEPEPCQVDHMLIESPRLLGKESQGSVESKEEKWTLSTMKITLIHLFRVGLCEF